MNDRRSTDPEIGHIGGTWAIMFKAYLALGLVILPFLMTWCVWITTQIFALQSELKVFMSAGPRYTSEQAQIDQYRVKQEIFGEIAKNYPPQWLRDEVGSISRRLTVIENEIVDMKKVKK